MHQPTFKKNLTTIVLALSRKTRRLENMHTASNYQLPGKYTQFSMSLNSYPTIETTLQSLPPHHPILLKESHNKKLKTFLTNELDKENSNISSSGMDFPWKKI
jgi:hypothetical protein